ncbi:MULTISPECIES: SDR family oxidoreductase [Streptomyces]|uniref:SDR family oxidoreductase n=1 Tax=Streptomyces TaxID=1883 RepID=UPI001F1AB905|nr:MULTISPECIES: SDR family oxidoreductase [Streptomyces]MCF2132179.1 SDR family oxidoreductase [Streptomyces sp. STD 3.1]WFB88483.1 SDR family oxidoreductase [Streptomyces olivaceus]WGK50926.1 SDR family oxidoreductase [Streptomyces sp. B146]
MKVAVMGGTGMIGSQVVKDLREAGHEAVGHSRSSGVDLTTGRGVAEAVAGADVVVDVTNSPTFDAASVEFFRSSATHLVEESAKAGVGHIVVLSIVGVDLVPAMDYYKAKVVQEEIVKSGSVPYSIVRATQFMEFVRFLVSMAAGETPVRMPSTPVQPITAREVADVVGEISVNPPLQDTVDLAGPEVFPFDELGRITLAAGGDDREVVTDDSAGMLAVVPGDALTAGEGARLAATRYQDWLS